MTHEILSPGNLQTQCVGKIILSQDDKETHVLTQIKTHDNDGTN